MKRKKISKKDLRENLEAIADRENYDDVLDRAIASYKKLYGNDRWVRNYIKRHYSKWIREYRR